MTASLCETRPPSGMFQKDGVKKRFGTLANLFLSYHRNLWFSFNCRLIVKAAVFKLMSPLVETKEVSS